MGSNDNNDFIARYGRTTIRGDDFNAICVELVAHDYMVTKMTTVAKGKFLVPHRDDKRKPAQIVSYHAYQAEEAQPEPAWVPEPVEVPKVVIGLKVRECGSVHSDGVVCMVAVYFETRCDCGTETVYAHDGPHEAFDADGNVIARWEEVLQIRDLPFNAYGAYDPATDGLDDDEEGVA